MTDHWHGYNPKYCCFLRPEWRWQRIEYLYESGRRLDKRVDDEYIALGRKAITKRYRNHSGVADIDAAHAIWTGDQHKRGKLEAWLLTNESEKDIATKLGIPQPVIEAYLAFFFDVRTKKSATDWLKEKAIEHSPCRGFFGPMPYAAWKLAAFAGGPFVLEITIAATMAEPLPALMPAEINASQFEAMKSQYLVKLWIQSCDAVSDEQFQQLIRDRRQYRHWVSTVTGIPYPVSKSVLAHEDLLLMMLGNKTANSYREYPELEVTQRPTKKRQPAKPFDIHEALKTLSEIVKPKPTNPPRAA